MAKDHTKSLLPYQTILKASEEEYRNTPLDDRDRVIGNIMEEIKQAAERARAEIADDNTVCKVCAFVLTSGIESN